MHRFWFERALAATYVPLLGEAEILGAASESPEAPLGRLPGAHAIIAGSRIRYNAALMDLAPTLRVIARTGIGYDNVDLAAATARGIIVTNTPDAPSIPTAEHTVALLLAAARRVTHSERLLRAAARQDYFAGHDALELAGRTLAVVGLGRIGGRVAVAMRALGMRVVGFDPVAPPARFTELGAAPAATLEEALAQADAVTLHLPLTQATRHLFDAAMIARIKQGAILVNCARGGLVDEAALLDALERGHLRGAALDVFEHEPPPPDHPLLSREDVVCTPHVGGASDLSKQRLVTGAIEQALMVLRGERPTCCVNPEVLSLES
ncbi:MAG: D-3-phosphoglycerate dehydrogenase [Chloroflexota bacterium]|jgi:D-3-phosphoglycerate dehydrogenase